MRIAVVGLGKMGQALAERLLDEGHQLRVWNRTAGRTGELQTRGATVMSSPDDLAGSDAVFVCLADDASVAEVAAPSGRARPAWPSVPVVNTATIAPETTTRLAELYGDRFVAAPIIGAPQAVRTGAATFITAGGMPARHALAPVWASFAGPIEAGEAPARAAVLKLLHNQMLLTGLTVVAETIRIGRAAGIDDTTLAATLRDSPQMPAGLQNRRESLFEPDHTGWFTSPLAAKDLTLALDLAADTAPMPVTEAARDTYRQVAGDGWTDTDITAITEYGSPHPATSTPPQP